MYRWPLSSSLRHECDKKEDDGPADKNNVVGPHDGLLSVDPVVGPDRRSKHRHPTSSLLIASPAMTFNEKSLPDRLWSLE